LSVLAPKLVQRFPFEWTVAHNTLSFGSIDNFPRLADLFVRRQFFPKQLSEFAAAPNALLEDRLEG
jgi:hypothetical protein